MNIKKIQKQATCFNQILEKSQAEKKPKRYDRRRNLSNRKASKKKEKEKKKNLL